MTAAHLAQEALEMAMDKKSRMLKYAVGERLAVFQRPNWERWSWRFEVY